MRGRKKRDIRARLVAQGLLAGKSDVAAVIDAGYSPETARTQAYEIVRRPSVQSELTEALRARGLTPDKMAGVIAEAAEAKMIVYNPDVGEGVLVDLPAHAIRLKAYDRWERAHGYVPQKIEMPSPPSKGLTVIIEQADPQGSAPTRTIPEPLPVPSGNGQDRPARTGLRVIISQANGSQENNEHGRE